MAHLAFVGTVPNSDMVARFLQQHGHYMSAAMQADTDLLICAANIFPDDGSNRPLLRLTPATFPMRLGDLLDQINRTLRLWPLQTQALLQRDGYELDTIAHQLRYQQTSIPLTDRETNMMVMLWQTAPAAVSREILLTQLWRYNVQAETHTIETHVYNLRQKFQAAGWPDHLITAADGGYSWHPTQSL